MKHQMQTYRNYVIHVVENQVSGQVENTSRHETSKADIQKLCQSCRSKSGQSVDRLKTRQDMKHQMQTCKNYISHVEANLVSGHAKKASRRETSNANILEIMS